MKQQCNHQNQLSLIFDADVEEIDIETTLQLRDYQQSAVKKVMEYLAKRRNTLLYFPTGGGKTEAAIAIVLKYISRKKRVLFVANRNELVNQTRERFLKYGIGTGVIQGDKKVNLEYRVQILSIDSFKNREQIIKSLDFDLVIIDEAHNHFNNRAYQLYKIFHNTKTVFLGLSATPFLQSKWKAEDKLPEFWLGDKSKPTYKTEIHKETQVELINYYYKSFGYIYQEIVAEVLPHHLRDMGFLVDAEVFHYDILKSEDLELNEDGTDYTDESVKIAMVTPETVAHIATEYINLPLREDGYRRQGLAFCVNIKHSQMLTKELISRGIKSAHIDCNTPPKIRKQLFQDYRDRNVEVLTSVDVVSEGFDMPQAEVALACRPTMSLIKVIQQLGRLLRVSPHTGKTKCIILDQANNCNNIVSYYLTNEQGFHPFDPIKVNKELLLKISEPPPLQTIDDEKKEGGGRGGLDEGEFGKASELRPHSERQANRIIKAAEENGWDDGQIKRTFRRTCLFPTSQAVINIADYLGYSPEETARFYYECGVYSAHFLGMIPGKSAVQDIDQMTLMDIKKEAIAFYRECDRLLREKKIVPDFAPEENRFFLQLRAAAQKFNKKNESPYPKALYLTLRRVIEAQMRRALNENDRLVYQDRLNCLNSQYEAVRARYKRVRKADARPVAY
jgi:superfamily II DNA or RNA helicase